MEPLAERMQALAAGGSAEFGSPRSAGLGSPGLAVGGGGAAGTRRGSNSPSNRSGGGGIWPSAGNWRDHIGAGAAVLDEAGNPVVGAAGGGGGDGVPEGRVAELEGALRNLDDIVGALQDEVDALGGNRAAMASRVRWPKVYNVVETDMVAPTLSKVAEQCCVLAFWGPNRRPWPHECRPHYKLWCENR